MNEELKELVIKTDRINKRLTIVACAAILTIAFISLINCIRDASIVASYFNQSVTQETHQDKLIQRFEGGK